MSTPAAITPAAITSSLVLAPASFVVGPDGAGHWLAIERHGRGGGIFVSQDAALHYARGECCHRPGAVALTRRRLALR